ncbi:hypothetical protein PENTCL1PPCAC_23492, partial [Pristionchus entomophagus]
RGNEQRNSAGAERGILALPKTKQCDDCRIHSTRGLPDEWKVHEQFLGAILGDSRMDGAHLHNRTRDRGYGSRAQTAKPLLRRLHRAATAVNVRGGTSDGGRVDVSGTRVGAGNGRQGGLAVALRLPRCHPDHDHRIRLVLTSPRHLVTYPLRSIIDYRVP